MSSRVADLPALTAIRGFAAFYVMFFHIRDSIDGLSRPMHLFLGRGYLAVDLFFVLSGFVIWLNYAARLRAAGPAGVPAYLWRRWARIWPLHVALLAGAAAMALLFALTGRADPVRYPFAELPLHVLLLQNWGFTPALTWNIPAWSISTEWAAYLAFPLLVAIDWRRLPTIVLAVAFALLLAILAYAYAPQGVLYLDVARYGLVRCLVEFALGTIVCALWRRSTRATGAIGGAVMLAAAPLLWLGGVPETIAAPLGFAGLVLFLACRPGLLGRSGPLIWLGEVSYSIYLSHVLIWIAFKLLFVRDAAHVGPVAIAAYVAIVVIASGLLHRFVERPAQVWLNAHPPMGTVRPQRD
ncbi:MAG: acyltransferase [Sphingomonas sanxanigenens]|uniref:Acyltransferase n=1 Tax=Sphingomonas sanxanigenens TaxID=397260 RepID=A0A2W5A9K5_9SPHN|nr:MAG: acyltransferase [Sphingomonas sanxanigenens]